MTVRPKQYHLALIVHCTVCGVEWDMDYDPPGCVDPAHHHDLITQEVDE